VDVAALLALADVLIQPGRDDDFNKYRLPAKLPEFLAMGRPVILPNTNAARSMRHGQDAWVLEKVDALTIVDAVRALRQERVLREQLSTGALSFCYEHFDWVKNAETLAAFYGKVMSTRQEPADVTTS
ncbi:MAG: glycosyltransferase, partial [Verrucomicrobiota bacterium]|nr:glycosyltransferase [Verrucomicrobiota bacterium]